MSPRPLHIEPNFQPSYSQVCLRASLTMSPSLQWTSGYFSLMIFMASTSQVPRRCMCAGKQLLFTKAMLEEGHKVWVARPSRVSVYQCRTLARSACFTVGRDRNVHFFGTARSRIHAPPRFYPTLQGLRAVSCSSSSCSPRRGSKPPLSECQPFTVDKQHMTFIDLYDPARPLHNSNGSVTVPRILSAALM